MWLGWSGGEVRRGKANEDGGEKSFRQRGWVKTERKATTGSSCQRHQQRFLKRSVAKPAFAHGLSALCDPCSRQHAGTVTDFRGDGEDGAGLLAHTWKKQFTTCTWKKGAVLLKHDRLCCSEGGSWEESCTGTDAFYIIGSSHRWLFGPNHGRSGYSKQLWLEREKNATWGCNWLLF